MKSFSLTLILSIIWALSAHTQSFIDSEAMQFREVGPERGGRCTAVEGVNDQPNIFYAGYTGSGVWKTTDYGETWDNISDKYFETPSIGSIDVFQNNPNIIYVGTGTDGLRSNLIAGRGMYKSTDAGKTWKHIGLKNVGQIGSVEINPYNPNIVFVAAIGNAFAPNAERGVFKTKNGGETWEKVLYISDKTGFSDIEFHPTDPQIVYAAAWMAQRTPWTIISGGDENGIYKSEDGGSTWKKIDSGLPKLAGKIDLAVSLEDPNRLYALIEAPRGEDGLYRSDDSGKSFKQISDKFELLNRPFYYTNLYADPTNADRIFSLATSAFESSDGGKTWKSFRAPHGDHHDIWINPYNNQLMIQSNDGGANISFNAGKTWSSQFNQPTSEIYQVEVDNQVPYWLYGGQQDNYTTVSVPSLPPYGMQAGHLSYIMNTGGCETGPAVPSPINSDIVYSNCKGKFSRYNKSTGQEQQYDVGMYFMYGHNPKDLPYRFQRVSPIHVSPHDPRIIYHCSQFVHKTTDEGKTWTTISPDLTAFTLETQVISGSPITRDITGEEFYSTIYDIQESKREKGVIWVGSNDGPIHVTKDGGKIWKNVTPADLGKGGRVDAVEPSVHKNGKAFACILRYQLGDPKPYIYKTLDYGKTWKLITKGIPSDFPVRVLREDPVVEGLLFAGTEYGLYISKDDGENWEKFQKNLPIVPITDLKIHQNDLVMSTMGRGFWILDDITSLRTSNAQSTSNTLIKPADTYALLYSGRRSSDAPNDHISYPFPGVNIDYYLRDSLSTPLFLEVIDDQGLIIRKYQSASSNLKDTSEVVENMNTSKSEYIETKSLKAAQGGYRFTWDLKHENKVLAKPGKYTVRLFSSTFDQKQSFELLPDPRMTADGFTKADYKNQEDFSLEVGALVKKVDMYVKSLEKEIKTLEKAETKTSDEDSKLKALKEKLDLFKNKEKTNYPQEMYVSQLNYLFGSNNATWQYINKDSKIRLKQLKQEFELLKK